MPAPILVIDALGNVGAEVIKRVLAKGGTIRAAQWKYVEYVTGEVELYDLVADPFELNNLASLPEYVSVLAELKARLGGGCLPRINS